MPGFVDVQINGYAGVDFNSDDLSLEQLSHACAALKRDGVEQILATLITAPQAQLCNRISRLVSYREQDPSIAELVVGLHIEGPFLNPSAGFIGAHPQHAATMASRDQAARILETAKGLVKIFTLAPERDPGQTVTRYLADQKVVVSAGHSDASLDELKAGIDAGLTMFTHLGNGCPIQLHRHDNIIQRVLSVSDQLWISFIADGAHLPFFTLQNYLRITGLDRVVIVTDAISAAGCGPGRFQLGERWVQVGADGVPRAEDHSHLVGSGTTMSQMAKNLSEHLQLSSEQIERLTLQNPLKLLNHSAS